MCLATKCERPEFQHHAVDCPEKGTCFCETTEWGEWEEWPCSRDCETAFYGTLQPRERTLINPESCKASYFSPPRLSGYRWCINAPSGCRALYEKQQLRKKLAEDQF